MLRILRWLLGWRTRPSTVVVHVVEWPSGREQGRYYVPTDRDSAIYAYPAGVDHYIDGVYSLSICNQLPASHRGPGDRDADKDRAISPRSE